MLGKHVGRIVGMRRLLAVVIGVLAGAVAGGLLDGIVWPGPPLALFRPQLTLALLVVSLLALGLGPRRVAVAGIAGAALGVALLVPALRSPEPEPPGAASLTVKVLTLNLWHRNDDVSAVSDLIARERPHVVALVELTPAWQQALAPVLQPYRIRAVEARAGTIGIGLYGRAHLRGPEVVRLLDGGRPAVEARLDVDGRVGRLLVVHPSGGLLPGDVDTHERELAAIGEWAREQGPRSVVCGDLNAAPWTRSLRDVLAEGELRAALPGGLFAGSWPALPPPLRVAVDGCLVGTGVRARAELGPRVGSDHLPVLVELA
jgi:endonuclease/exonuclease/phosphatase (EEP) superfamily protein YafD